MATKDDRGGLCERALKHMGPALAPPPRVSVPRLGACLALALLVGAAVTPLRAQDVLAGIDVWTTPGGGTTFANFAEDPVPAGFFGPGSDPFTGEVVFGGDPLPSLGGPSLFPSDTVVERTQTATMPGPATVPIEIKALSLVSSQPIMVTYDGQNPELWDVRAARSSAQTQEQGWMIIERICPQGGTFASTLPVKPKMIFTRQSDLQVQVLDPGPEVELGHGCGRWVYQADATLGVLRLPEGAVTDGDFNHKPDDPLPATSNFVPGVWDLSCDPACPSPPLLRQILRMDNEDEMLAAHGILPSRELTPPDTDLDGIDDGADNCLNDSNPLQEDVDDDDGVGDACDNCVYRYNPCQEDVDGNGVGDVCEGEVFYNGFECRHTKAWSLVVPPT